MSERLKLDCDTVERYAITEQQQRSLIQYVQLLHKWNKVYNLTATSDVQSMLSRHIVDSLSVIPFLKSLAADSTIMDVGSGAGLPVIPLALMREDLNFVSVETVGKKTRFQQQALTELKLTNVTIEQQRVEQVETVVDVVVSRAFTAPDNFLKLVQKNVKLNGQVIIMLGLKERLSQDLPAGYVLQSLDEVSNVGDEAQRHIAVCVLSSLGKRG